MINGQSGDPTFCNGVVTAALQNLRRPQFPESHVTEKGCNRVGHAACWLEFSVASGMTKPEKVAALRKEADELLAIFNTSRQTARANLQREQAANNRPSAEYVIPD